jgi:hypothetical protein
MTTGFGDHYIPHNAFYKTRCRWNKFSMRIFHSISYRIIGRLFSINLNTNKRHGTIIETVLKRISFQQNVTHSTALVKKKELKKHKNHRKFYFIRTKIHFLEKNSTLTCPPTFAKLFNLFYVSGEEKFCRFMSCSLNFVATQFVFRKSFASLPLLLSKSTFFLPYLRPILPSLLAQLLNRLSHSHKPLAKSSKNARSYTLSMPLVKASACFLHPHHPRKRLSSNL